MAFGPKLCACCGSAEGVEAHHLYTRRAGYLDDLTVWLCFTCHGRAHEKKQRVNIVSLTTDALATAKAKSVQPGNRTNLPAAQLKGAKTNAARADAFAAHVLPVVRQIQASGATSLAELATALNRKGIPTARGGTWYAMTVRNLLLRGKTH